MSQHEHTCPCGCVLAAWSMPWPVTSGAAAPWSPAVVHDAAPVAHVYALFPPTTAYADLIDPTAVAPNDLHLIDTHLDIGPDPALRRRATERRAS